jgi:4-carboxymuconolactone decarboxylase
MENPYDKGMRVRREVLGDAHVDQAVAATTPMDESFQRFITEWVWGGVWGNPDLDRKTRSLVTIAILAALGSEELDLHLRASLRTGVTDEELAQVIGHVAVYAGVPAANTAMKRAKAIRGGEK